jgi:hypothetical protein
MKEIEMVGTHRMCGEMRIVHNILFRRPVGKNLYRKLGRLINQ